MGTKYKNFFDGVVSVENMRKAYKKTAKGISRYWKGKSLKLTNRITLVGNRYKNKKNASIHLQDEGEI